MGVGGALLATLVAHGTASADEEPAPSETREEPANDAPSAPQRDPETPAMKATPVAYVEASYSYNFNRPSNGITNYRAFDNRHNTFLLSNVALGGEVESGPVAGRLVLQVGQTPSSYYAAEPTRLGATGVSASDGALWKYVQEAWVAYDAPVGRGLRFQLGLFLSPIGPETIAVKENWNWSRSNLFFALPYYHVGLRATYQLTDRISATAAVYNGWNDVIDDNEAKSVAASVAYKVPNALLVQVLYFGGVERPAEAPEGPYWRHDFDAYAQWDITERVAAILQGNAGWEYDRFGLSDWYAGALSGRVKIVDWLFVAVRGDRFWEDVASNAIGQATPIFWSAGPLPRRWVSSGTATVDVRPHEHVSIRLEYRHDEADGAMFFRGSVAGDGTAAAPWLPNSKRQDTVTFGVTGWL